LPSGVTFIVKVPGVSVIQLASRVISILSSALFAGEFSDLEEIQ
jgi:hypothetical protein